MLARMLIAMGLALSFGTPGRAQAPPDSLHIVGGLVCDGRGVALVQADLAVQGDRIVLVGDVKGRTARRVIDARSCVLTPGFVDVHAHADADVLKTPHAENFVRMGVTTIITGNCGGSVLEVGTHLSAVDVLGLGVNYGTLIGHGSMRERVLGSAKRAPSKDEQAAMETLLAKGLKDGAFGLSTGLIYVPGTYAETEELIGLARVLSREGGLYASHIRNESDDVLVAIEEALRIGRESGAPVHLSHLKVSGKANHGRAGEILKVLRTARAAGAKVSADQYAYAASSTSLDVLFPTEPLQVGRARFAKKLSVDADFRAEMERALQAEMDRAGFTDFVYAQIASAPHNEPLEGLSLREAAERKRKSTSREAQAAVAVDLMIEALGQRVGMVYHKMAEADVRTIVQEPWIGVASDSGVRTHGARPHPRGSGNNPRVLGHYARDEKLLTLEAAVAKMTGIPAATFGVVDRGEIREGAYADLVLLDPETVKDLATYEEPYLAPLGIRMVIVNGQVALEDGKLSEVRAGRALRRK